MIVLAFLFFTQSASAVDTRFCPDYLNVTYARISAMFSLDVDSDLPQIENARRVLEKIKPEIYRDVLLYLSETLDSKCTYEQVETPAEEHFKIVLMSVYGNDYTRVIMNVGPYSYWIYHDVEYYSLSGIKLKGAMTSPVEAVRQRGNPVRVGWAVRPLIN